MELTIIAHNIRSAENIGSLLRTADALGIENVYLTGYSPDITHPKVKKTALGAEISVPCSKQQDIQSVILKLKQAGYLILGLELDERAVALEEFKTDQSKLALLLGNEVDGIPSYLRDECDKLIYIPQYGIKESLNVTIAAAISSYQLLKNN